VIGATRLPQIFGDPDVKYIGQCVFVYSSIMIKKFTDTTAVQTMSLHRSTDCGKTWQGPFEITAATNPNGIVEEDEPADAADKEFMDVDPDTGRLIISWSNFTPDPQCVLRQCQARQSADLVGGDCRLRAARRRTGLDSALRRRQQQCVCRMASLPVPRDVRRPGQYCRIRALAQQWRDLAGADQHQQRVFHDGSGVGQRPREYFALAGGGQFARAAARHDLSRLRQQQ
jgi:hypothetical protein